MSRAFHAIGLNKLVLAGLLAASLLGAVASRAQDTDAPQIPAAFGGAEKLFQEGKWAEASKSLQDFTKNNPFTAFMPEALYYEAWCLYNQGQYEDAANAFARVTRDYIKTRPALAASSLLKQAESYRELKNFPKALSFYPEFRQKFPSSELMPQALLSEANTYYRQYTVARDKKESPDPAVLANARQVAQAVRSRYPQDLNLKLESMFLLGQIALDEGNTDEAKKIYQELRQIRNNPRATDALFMAGEAMFVKKRYDDAVTYYDRVQSKAALIADTQAQMEDFRKRMLRDPDNRTVLEARMSGLRQLVVQLQGQPDRRSAALFRIANCYQFLQKPEEAVVIYRQFLRLYPKDSLVPQARLGLIEVLTQSGRPKEVEAESKTLQAENPGGGSDFINQALFLQAKSMFDTGQFKDALEKFKEFSSKSSEPEAKQTADFYVGACSQSLAQASKGAEAEQHLAAARDAFGKFIETYPTSKFLAEASFRRARSSFELYQAATDPKVKAEALAAAAAQYEEVKSKYAKSEFIPDVTFSLAYIYSYLAESDKDTPEKWSASYQKAMAAFTEFATTYGSDPRAPEAAYQIGSILYLFKRTPECVKALKEVVDKYPDNKLACTASFDIAKAYAQDTNNVEMVKSLREFAARCPDNDQLGTALYAIAADYQQHDQVDDAAVEYRHLIKVASEKADVPDSLLNSAVAGVMQLAGILEKQEKFGEALAECEGFLDKFIQKPIAVRAIIAEIVTLHRNASKIPEAYAKLTALADKYAGNDAARIAAITGIIELAQTKKDYRAAYAATVRVLADPLKDNLPGTTYLAAANTLLKTDHYAEALDVFKKAGYVYASDQKIAAAALAGCGIAQLNLGKIDEAEDSLNKALEGELGPAIIDAKLGIGRVHELQGAKLLEAGNKEDAEKKLQQAYTSYVELMGVKSDAAGEATFRIGMFYLTYRKEPSKALGAFMQVPFRPGGSLFAEESLFRAGECHVRLCTTGAANIRANACESARQTLASYLKRYPAGKFIAEAQKYVSSLPAPQPGP